MPPPRLFALLAALAIGLAACDVLNPRCGEGFHTWDRRDALAAPTNGDSMTVVLLSGYELLNVAEEFMPEVRYGAAPGDSLRLALDVDYGSYERTPHPAKEAFFRNDTLFVWYAPNDFQREGLDVIVRVCSPATPYAVLHTLRVDTPASVRHVEVLVGAFEGFVPGARRPAPRAAVRV